MQAEQQQKPPPEDSAPVEDYGSDSEEEWLAPPKEAEDRSPPRLKEVNPTELDENERDLAGDAVPIQFNLPNGTSFTKNYMMGHTIAYIKGHLEDLYQLPYEATQLFMNGKLLIDPLSLNDLPMFVANQVNVVDVKVAGQ